MECAVPQTCANAGRPLRARALGVRDAEHGHVRRSDARPSPSRRRRWRARRAAAGRARRAPCAHAVTGVRTLGRRARTTAGRAAVARDRPPLPRRRLRRRRRRRQGTHGLFLLYLSSSTWNRNLGGGSLTSARGFASCLQPRASAGGAAGSLTLLAFTVMAPPTSRTRRARAELKTPARPARRRCGDGRAPCSGAARAAGVGPRVERRACRISRARPAPCAPFPRAHPEQAVLAARGGARAARRYPAAAHAPPSVGETGGARTRRRAGARRRAHPSTWSPHPHARAHASRASALNGPGTAIKDVTGVDARVERRDRRRSVTSSSSDSSSQRPCNAFTRDAVADEHDPSPTPKGYCRFTLKLAFLGMSSSSSSRSGSRDGRRPDKPSREARHRPTRRAFVDTGFSGFCDCARLRRRRLPRASRQAQVLNPSGACSLDTQILSSRVL